MSLTTDNTPHAVATTAAHDLADSAHVLRTVQGMVNAHPDAFTLGGLRHILFYLGHELEAAGVVVRFGRKLLIDETEFFDWLKAGGARNIRTKVQQRASRKQAKGAV